MSDITPIPDEAPPMEPPSAKPEMLVEAPVGKPASLPNADDSKKERRKSMFQEAANVSDLGRKPGESTDMSTLQAFFKDPTMGTQDKALKNKSQIRRPKLFFENTFRLESKKPFVASRIEALIQEILEEQLSDLRYCSKTAGNTCAQLAELIRNRVMVYDYDRYKLVVHVALGSMSRQGFCFAFKHLGDPNRDLYAQGNFTNHHVFVAASVHAVYYE